MKVVNLQAGWLRRQTHAARERANRLPRWLTGLEDASLSLVQMARTLTAMAFERVQEQIGQWYAAPADGRPATITLAAEDLTSVIEDYIRLRAIERRGWGSEPDSGVTVGGVAEPSIHSNITDSLDEKHPLAFQDVFCTKCSKMVHASNNECMVTWAETRRGPICLSCLAEIDKESGIYAYGFYDVQEIT